MKIKEAYEKGLIKNGVRVRTNGGWGIEISDTMREGKIIDLGSHWFKLEGYGGWEIGIDNDKADIKFLDIPKKYTNFLSYYIAKSGFTPLEQSIQTTRDDNIWEHKKKVLSAIAEKGWEQEGVEYYKPNNIKNMIQKIPNTLKRVLNKELSSLYKVGFINGDLDLTESGRRELTDVLFVEYQAQLAERANEIIKEEKKDKK